jgi:hypothetical protein
LPTNPRSSEEEAAAVADLVAAVVEAANLVAEVEVAAVEADLMEEEAAAAVEADLMEEVAAAAAVEEVAESLRLSGPLSPPPHQGSPAAAACWQVVTSRCWCRILRRTASAKKW